MRYNVETPENMKSVWMINLTPIRIVCLATHLNPPFIAPHIDPQENTRTGSIIWLKFNTIYILQHEENEPIMIRVIEHNPGPIDEVPPIHYHNGDPNMSFSHPITTITEPITHFAPQAVDMNVLLSQLRQCAVFDMSNYVY
jgi:hypothetical protein